MNNNSNKLICKDMYNSIKTVVGKSSNSASPTDTWILSFKKSAKYDGNPIEKCF